MKPISSILLLSALLCGCAAYQPEDAAAELWRLSFEGGIGGDFDVQVTLKKLSDTDYELLYSFNQKLRLSGLSEGDVSVSVNGKIMNEELTAEIFGSGCFELAGGCGSINGSMSGKMSGREGSGAIQMSSAVREGRTTAHFNFIGDWHMVKYGTGQAAPSRDKGVQ